MARRQHLSLMLVVAVVAFLSISYLFSGGSSDAASPAPLKGNSAPSTGDIPNLGHISDSILSGESIAPKLENATAKAELGRASWKLFHTMMARFPEKPTPDDSLALKTYIQLFARLYPCGDCAAHFRKLLAKYPPQTSSRIAAAGWACFVHNEVNTRLKKEQFDCSKIGDFYDCGCGDDDKKKAEGEKKPSLELEKDG
ncbi:FAD-linked sulfhydryl oxidase erv2 [Colletotrichum truncatum]|uniref:FAD-linked sulfhydryl oxidase erv2 n=1 Tax=Colletotrichum truncatum TaxID=5467 RepID=A0ACC3Z2K6_COLTU|nr:FAD-linked sulfhydryl oxidase erv2 [Colletotrichum truncatum]KAF6782676.1 FAD-linked sulfhydryl oxidase erv2 [Colletotrichum truncatum]